MLPEERRVVGTSMSLRAWTSRVLAQQLVFSQQQMVADAQFGAGPARRTGHQCAQADDRILRRVPAAGRRTGR